MPRDLTGPLPDPDAVCDNPKTLLLVEDDQTFRDRLARAMTARGFSVQVAEGVVEAIACARQSAPEFAICDLRLGDGSGLDVVDVLKRLRPDCRILVLTSYGNIATAVLAIKEGAAAYLSKPANADEILSALTCYDETRPEIPANPMSADRVRWEHLQRIYELCNHNTSETARRLKMHRRTIQRIFNKHAPR